MNFNQSGLEESPGGPEVQAQEALWQEGYTFEYKVVRIRVGASPLTQKACPLVGPPSSSFSGPVIFTVKQTIWF